MEITEPAQLASIPLSHLGNGKKFYTQVHGIVGGRKRKRQEISVAVDGDSISIYEIRNGRNLSSCPIPPDSSLSCPPCTIQSKTDTGRKRRSIYYVTEQRNQANLVMFRDNADELNSASVSKSIVLQDSTAQVIQLEAIPVTNIYELVVLRNDGYFEVHDADLTSRKRMGNLLGIADGYQLVAAQCFSVTHALKSVLRARPDIVALADPSSLFVLGVCTSSSVPAAGEHSDIQLKVWQLPGVDTLAESTSEVLLYHSLAISSPLIARERHPILFASKDTRLIVKTQSKAYVFDLTSASFRRIQTIAPVAPDQLSSIYISDALTLCSTPASLQLYNTQFRTIQSKLDLRKTGQKRKRGSAGNGPDLLIDYFPSSNRVVAVRREQLVAIDLKIANSNDFSSAAKQTSLLINNIGRGLVSQEHLKPSDRSSEGLVGRTINQTEAIEQWHRVVQQLEQFVQAKDITNFEKLYIEEVTERSAKMPKESSIVINSKIDYAITKLFDYETLVDETSAVASQRLALVFPALKVFEMLATKGLLTMERINKVLRSNSETSLATIKHGAISQILMDSDSSLDLFCKHLEEAPYIAYQELCTAVLLLLRQALAESKVPSSLVIEDTRNAVATDVDSTGSALDSGVVAGTVVAKVTTALCVALERLVETAPDRLSSFMQESFTQEEIIALVQFLRQQLFRSGYTRSLRTQPYPSPPPSEHGSPPDEQPVNRTRTDITLPTITSALSSCIDAIGPVGVLSFGDEDTFFQRLIPELQSEISRATEAVQDSMFLEGMLRETLRFVESAPRAPLQETGNETEPNAAHPKPGSIVTLYSEVDVDGSNDHNAALLPLGMRAEGKISTVKSRKGNGALYTRSEREMGMHQDRLRGPYALERLVL